MKWLALSGSSTRMRNSLFVVGAAATMDVAANRDVRSVSATILIFVTGERLKAGKWIGGKRWRNCCARR